MNETNDLSSKEHEINTVFVVLAAAAAALLLVEIVEVVAVVVILVLDRSCCLKLPVVRSLLKTKNSKHEREQSITSIRYQKNI